MGFSTWNYEKATLCLSISIVVKISSRKQIRVELSSHMMSHAEQSGGCAVQATIKLLIALLSVNVIGQAGSTSMKHWASAPDHSDYRVRANIVGSIQPFQLFGFKSSRLKQEAK